MIVFHFVFFLDFLSLVQMAYGQGGWFILARFVQWSFLLLVGIGIQLSYQKTIADRGLKIDFLKKNIFRGLIVFCAGLLVTLASWLFLPEGYIRFGVLHLIGASIIILGFIVNYPRFALLLSLLFYLASFPINTIIIPESYWLILGFYVENFYTLDYFPIFPWMGVPALGIWLGHILLKGYQRNYPNPAFLESSRPAQLLAALGQRSLMIYLIHVPIIIGIIVVTQKLF